MSEVKRTNLGTYNGVGVGQPVNAAQGNHTFAASITGAGALSASIAIMGSNDLAAWALLVNLAPINGGQAATAVVPASYAYWRADVAAITNGANVTIVAASEEGPTQAEPLSPARVPIRRRRSAILTSKPFGQAYGDTGADNVTVSNVHAVPSRFQYVRGCFENGTATVRYVDGFKVAASSSLSDRKMPTDANNAEAAWSALATFDGNGVFGDPLADAAAGATTSATVPVAAVLTNALNIVSSEYCSDWIRIDSLDRIDVSSEMRLLFTRTMCTGAGRRSPMMSMTPAAMAAWEADPATGLQIPAQNFYWAGDKVTNPAAANAGGAQIFGGYCPAKVQFATAQQGYTIGFVGDSNLDGFGTATQRFNFGHKATRLLSNGNRPVVNLAYGYDGQNAIHATKNALKLIASGICDILFIQGWSINDGTTQQNFVDDWARLLTVLQVGSKAGITVVVSTGIPDATFDAPITARWSDHNAKVLALRNSGVPVLDVASLVSQPGAGAARILPAYDFGDGRHINQVAHNVVGAALAALLDPLMF